MKEKSEINQAAAGKVFLAPPPTNFLPAILAQYCILGVPKVLCFLMSKTQGLQQV